MLVQLGMGRHAQAKAGVAAAVATPFAGAPVDVLTNRTTQEQTIPSAVAKAVAAAAVASRAMTAAATAGPACTTSKVCCLLQLQEQDLSHLKDSNSDSESSSEAALSPFDGLMSSTRPPTATVARVTLGKLLIG